MKIIVAGDLSLQDRAHRLIWDENQLNKSFGSLKEVICRNDFALVNLESPVTNNNEPLLKDGPILKNNKSVFDIIKYCDFDVITLANNHLKDYGTKGVSDTISCCKDQNLLFVGAGSNIEDARKPLVLSDDNIRIGIINVCEHESSIASKVSAGSNPYDISNLFYDISSLKKKVDKIVVIIHGGREHYQLPTPRMKREYHLIIDMGADVIVNHHQHCYSGYEVYNDKLIFYGLGNLFFDNPSKRNMIWNYGLLLQLVIEKDQVGYNLIPFEQCNANPVINFINYEEIKIKIDELNEIISDDTVLESAFEKMVEGLRPLSPFLPYGNHYLRALYNRGLLPDFITKKNKVKIENSLSCETHLEVLLHYLNRSLHNE